MSDDFFAPPPFDADSALATFKRTLRDLKLVERGAAFEMNGRPVVRARAEGGLLRLEVVRRPSGSPEWERSEARDHAQLRRFTDDLKKRLARWADSRGDD
jgi:sulfur carrier protein ThiS